MTRLPQLTKFYGLKPWDFDRMTLREVSEYVTRMERATEEGDSGYA